MAAHTAGGKPVATWRDAQPVLRKAKENGKLSPSDREMPGSSDHAVLDGDLLDLRCRALVCNEKNLARANDPMEQLPPWDMATHRLQLSDVGWNL